MGGGPIGLQLTGAVSRAYMMRWDKLYKKKVLRAGIDMLLYERYIDDSNQSAVVPQPGAVFDTEEQKVVIDNTLASHDDDEEARLARVLKTIAKDVIPEIQMVEDFPAKNEDGKMPVLDMNVWMCSEHFILYEHYEKPMSCQMVISAQSAISPACKKAVHTQEILRRLFNCSRRLDWSASVAPVITDYMGRMMQGGYPETYRRNILCRALGIFDSKLEDDRSGVRPLYRPKNYDLANRRKEKQQNKYNWSNKGGYLAPIFVPPTPQSELANQLKSIAETEAEEGVRFKVIDTGGRSIKSIVQKSNPTATLGCEAADCLPCKNGRGDGGDCRRCGVNYSIECELCPDGQKAVYHGETARNIYTRGREHENNFKTKTTKSFMLKHIKDKHPNAVASYSAKVTATAKDCLTRQVREAVHLRRSEVLTLNSKTEWHQPALFRIQQEIFRG
jgi:hypothetical protein